MSRFLYRILASSALIATMTVGALAQTTDVLDQDQETSTGASRIVCGTILFNDGGEKAALAKTALNNPELYQRILERSKESTRRYVQSSGDEIINTFLMRNRVSGQFEEVQAALRFMGRRARIWVDVRDTGRIKMTTTIIPLARGLDSTTGTKSRDKAKSIIENDEDVFGLPPVNHFDESTTQDFLLTDIKDNLNNGFVAGFFSPYDQTDAPGSNKMNVLYIDSKEGLSAGVGEILSTLAHEFQHLIHYATNNQSEVVFNEGCSEVASILNGYQSRGNSGFAGNTNVPMFGWNYDDGTKLLADYERAMTFVYYLYEQYGENFLTTFNKTKTRGMTRVTDALHAIGNNDDWKDILAAWTAANYMKTFSQPYGYKAKLAGNTPAPTNNYTQAGTFADTGFAELKQYASLYNVYTKPGPIKVTFHSSRAIRVMAMLYKGSTPVEVWQLDRDSSYVIGSYATYDKVVFGVVSFDNGAQNVGWKVEKLTLGVDNEEAATGGLAVTSIAPNPVRGAATVSFMMPSAGEATVQIYDSRGALVRTVADAQRFEAGVQQLPVSTEGLATGAYMLRVTQGARSASHVMVVMR